MSNEFDLSTITLDDLLDSAILSHGFMPYKRDYYFHIETLWKEPNAGQYNVLFRHCYEMSYKPLTGAGTLIEAWDECFISMKDYEKAGSPEGYVWGTNWFMAYPGFSQVEDSLKAKQWSEKLGKPMQEVKLEGEIFQFSFIFHDWSISKINSQTGLISQALFPLGD